MIIKVTPWYDHSNPEDPLTSASQKSEFDSYVNKIMGLGFSMKLMHFTDGSVLLHKLTIEEFEAMTK